MSRCLLSNEFGDLYWKPLRLVCLIICVCVSVYVAVPISLLYLHGLLQPIPPVVVVVNWLPGTVIAPWNIDSFAGGS